MVSLGTERLEMQREKWAQIKKDISNRQLAQEAASTKELIQFKKVMISLTNIWNHLVFLRIQGLILIKMQEKEHCTARKFSLNLQLLEAKTIFPNEVYFDFIKFKFNIILKQYKYTFLKNTSFFWINYYQKFLINLKNVWFK